MRWRPGLVGQEWSFHRFLLLVVLDQPAQSIACRCVESCMTLTEVRFSSAFLPPLTAASQHHSFFVLLHWRCVQLYSRVS